jgi:lipoyl(octanoyl) transferase
MVSEAPKPEFMKDASFVYTGSGGLRGCEIALPDSMISILQLGTVDYATGLSLQQRLVQLRKDGLIGDVLLLLEHTPVITLGRNAKAANVIASREQLAARGVEIYECDRGGDVTFHGPGQLVGYPIFDLRGFASTDGKRKTLGAVEFVRRLEEVLIRTCADFRIPAKRISGLTGVWTNPEVSDTHVGTGAPAVQRSEASELDKPAEAKIAALGIHISRSVTSHGFALNVNVDLDYFKLIVPCGITSKPVTSMAKQLGRQLSLQEVAHSVSRNSGVVFQSQMLWLETLDSLLGHSVGVPMKPPAELEKLRGEEESFWV